MNKHRIQKIESKLPDAMSAERFAIGREIFRIKRSESAREPSEKISKRLFRLEKRLQASISKKSWRKKNLPEITYNPDLPITAKKDEIIRAIVENQVLIISGETGSGKSTQIPKFCLAAGRGIDGKIGCTQPRRIAATSVSRRIAEELGEDLGKSIGYKIRFKDRIGKDSFIKMMTDGILLAETQTDPHLNEYDTLIVDEAHERSLNIDFILGILKTLLEKRKNLKLIITSATIDTEKFSKAFNNAPVIEVSGRMYPVEVRYVAAETGDGDEPTHVELAVRAVESLHKRHSVGDILIFMPTEQDIRETCELLEGRSFKGVTVLPLYARLATSEQTKIFSALPGRKIIVATNVAETSITVPGIKYVIDTGLARISQYIPRTRTTALPVLAISKSSVDQRKGRCGRVESGICIRLYPEDDYQSRPLFTPPEIQRSNLAEVILRMIALNLGAVSEFPFIDGPSTKSITDGFDLLSELGAIVLSAAKKGLKITQSFSLTSRGKLMSKMPLDPRLSRMLIEAGKEGCLDEIAVITSVLSIRDPRERPVEKADMADRSQAIFNDPASDFITYLNIWNGYNEILQKEKSTNRLKKFCREHFLSFRRMREWRDIYNQIARTSKECGLKNSQSSHCLVSKVRSKSAGTGKTANHANAEFSPSYAAIHRSILSGFLSSIAVKKEKNIFKATKGREAMIFPGSGLFNKAGEWIVATEMVETTRLFARTVANIDSRWLENLGKDLCRYTYLEPHWDRKNERVVAYEQVSLFGLVIVSRRQVAYGRINPKEATEIFIRQALVECGLKKLLPFMRYNQKLIDEVRDLENRIRRRDLLVSEEDIVSFYKERLNEIYAIRDLKKLLKKKGGDHFLKMKKEDLLRGSPDENELSSYPDRIALGNRIFECLYKFDPGETEDGVTVKIPLRVVTEVPPNSTDWLVPGLFKEKITALLKGLPKEYRKKLVPISHTVDIILNELPRKNDSLRSVLSRFIYDRFGLDIPASAWPWDSLPDHLKMRISITDPKGETIRSGREKTLLRQDIFSDVSTDQLDSAKKIWEKAGLTSWDFGDLPNHISLGGQDGAKWDVYPGLEKISNAGKKTNIVNLRLYKNRKEALESHQRGVAALFTVYLSKDLKFLRKKLALPKELSKAAEYFGGKRRFEKKLYESILKDLLYKNIRSKAAFEAYAASAAQEIFSHGEEKCRQAVALLEVYYATRQTIAGLERINRTNQLVLDFLKELRSELTKLVPESFMDLYDLPRMIHIQRYLKALEIRAQRGIVNLEKDQFRAIDLKIYQRRLREILKDLSPAISEEKKSMIEEFFWLIEEFKVSLFAQELKTPFPVSKKRLDEKLKEIERIV
ncbi:ATP-dependent RNA helicase HrpA [Thermodesulfobacteriota bacterium]